MQPHVSRGCIEARRVSTCRAGPVTVQVMGGTTARIDWASLDVPAWLSDRLERLGFKFPTGTLLLKGIPCWIKGNLLMNQGNLLLHQRSCLLHPTVCHDLVCSATSTPSTPRLTCPPTFFVTTPTPGRPWPCAEVQRRSTTVLMGGMDAAIQSETGSGKTLSFLVPILARMQYPPDFFLEDLKGPQARARAGARIGG